MPHLNLMQYNHSYNQHTPFYVMKLGKITVISHELCAILLEMKWKD